MAGDRFIVEGAEIVVVPIEDEMNYMGILTSDDITCFGALYDNARRRAEAAAWRAAVREKLGREVDIYYNEVGAPMVSGSGAEYHINVTHTSKFAAVIFSDWRCAIDMEDFTRSFDRVADRFISPSEAALPESGHPLFKCAVWCAKEALYKYAGRKGIDLLRDMKITATDIGGGKISGMLLAGDGTWSECTLGLMTYGGKYLIVYITS